MRCLNRNKVPFWYALYVTEKPLYDEDGFKTSESEIIYSNPVAEKGNVRANTGAAAVRAFGLDLNYDRVIELDNPSHPIKETSVLWIDTPPVLNEDGTTDTPFDYVVKKIAPSLNSLLIAVSKVNVRG